MLPETLWHMTNAACDPWNSVCRTLCSAFSSMWRLIWSDDQQMQECWTENQLLFFFNKGTLFPLQMSTGVMLSRILSSSSTSETWRHWPWIWWLQRTQRTSFVRLRRAFLVPFCLSDFMISCFSHFTLSVLGFVSVPKVDQINQRLGPLAQEFTELVYPASYNPESKPAAKRKSGQGCNVYLARTLVNLH